VVDILDMWGKYFGGDTPFFRPLIHHMVDVSAVADVMWSQFLSPVTKAELSSYLRLNEKDAGSWMSFWAGLHDVGKATPAFQAKRPEARAALASKGYRFSMSDKPHGLMTTYIVNVLSGPGHPLALPSDLKRTVCFSLGGHHGIFPNDYQITKVKPFDAGTGSWVDAQKMLVDRLATICGVSTSFRPSPDPGINGAFFTVLSGLTSIADWIASSDTFFDPRIVEMNLDDYANLARRQAAKAVNDLRWSPNGGRNRTFSEMFPHIRRPYPLQEEAVELADRLEGPSLTIIEAPMGEGKTEAALYLAEAIAERSGYHGFYIGLPTQATADQMFSRALDCLRRGNKAVNLTLLHGHAVVSSEYQQLRIMGEVPDEPGYEVTAGEWFTHRKRGLLSTHGVGTVDQALLSVLPTKHFFVRLFGLAGKTVIVDEVHSYDLYMSTLLDRMLIWLKALGSSMILLSATLPSGRRNKIMEAYAGHSVTLPEKPYPRLTWSSGGTEGNVGFPSASLSSGRPGLVPLSWVDDIPTSIMTTIRGTIERGGTMAIICNTVAKAQDTYLSLKEHFRGTDVDVDLFHARYPHAMRKMRQDMVLERFGRGERDPEARRVLVATQVIEQSLDLDFDAMMTELAPVDLVLQRMGRLHRHVRTNRPPHLTAPTLYLIEPHANDDGTPDYGPSRFVYSEHVLLRSHLCLKQMNAVRIPQDIEGLVEKVYGGQELPTPSEAWGRALSESRRRLDDVLGEKEMKGLANVIPLPTYGRPWEATQHPLDEDDPDIHENLQAQTRDSPPNVQAVCLFDVEGEVCLRPDGEGPVDLKKEPSAELVRLLLDRAVAISDREVVRQLKSEPTPPGWQKSSLFNKHKVILFKKIYSSNDHYCHIGGKWLLLNEEIGLSIAEGELVGLQPDR